MHIINTVSCNDSLDISDPINDLKKLWAIIENLEGIRMPLEEQQQNYLSVLKKFQDNYSKLREDSLADWNEKYSYVEEEIVRIENMINKPAPSGLQQQIDRLLPRVRARRFRIISGFLNDGTTVARIDYMYDIQVFPGGDDRPVIDYWEYLPSLDNGNGIFKLKKEHVRTISGELTAQLIDLALKKPLIPCPDDAPAFKDISIFGSGTWYLSIRKPAEPCADYHIQIQDSITGTDLDSCGNIIQVNFDRIATQVPNPDCERQKIIYTGILASTQNYNTPPQTYNYIDDGEGKTLPSGTIDSPNFDSTLLNNHFESNLNNNSYTEAFSIPVTAPPIIANGTTFPITINYWTAVVTAPATALLTLQPVIDFLNYYCNSSVTILGQLDYGLPRATAFTNTYTPTQRIANGIPAAVINPVDYIFVKGQNVAAILAGSPLLNNPTQVIAPTLATTPAASLNIASNRALGTNVIVTVNYIPND